MKLLAYTKTELSWILYDVGNSAFVLLASSIIPVYFNALADNNALVAWSYGETVASLIVALLMPVLGSIADMQGMKHKFIIGAVSTGVLACICLGFPTNAWIFLLIYILTSVMLNSSMIFYDALLVDATTDERMDEVSTAGYAWGYIGSVIPFIFALILNLGGKNFGISSHLAMQLTFLICGLWWAAFTIPMLKNVPQKHYKPLVKHAISKSFKGLSTTFKKIWANAPMRYYMISYFFYIDGVHTIIKLSTSYGASLGIESTQLVLALLVTQIVAFPAAIAYGKLSAKLGTRTMLLVGIAGYGVITTFAAYFLHEAWQFWVLAIMVGLFQGGLQALSRSEFGKLCPKTHSNEYFGFFNIFGKYAAILGTFLVGFISQVTGDASHGVFSIMILFIFGFLIMLLKVPTKATRLED